MTNEEIKKALEMCVEISCDDCPYLVDSHGNCTDRLKTDALNLIIKQEKKIKQLKAKTAREILQTLYDKCCEINDETGESMGNFIADDDILSLAKHYNVEVKE